MRAFKLQWQRVTVFVLTDAVEQQPAIRQLFLDVKVTLKPMIKPQFDTTDVFWGHFRAVFTIFWLQTKQLISEFEEKKNGKKQVAKCAGCGCICHMPQLFQLGRSMSVSWWTTEKMPKFRLPLQMSLRWTPESCLGTWKQCASRYKEWESEALKKRPARGREWIHLTA